MIRLTILLCLLISGLTYGQLDLQLRDSIIKYKNINPNKAIELGLSYTQAVQEKVPDSLVVGTYALIGNILSDMGLDASALSYYDNALKLYESMPNKNKRAPEAIQPPWILVNIGNIYLKNGEYLKAREKYNKAISIFKSLKNKQNAFYGINTSESNLGLIEQNLQDFKAAENIYLKVYHRRLKKNKPEDVLYSLSQLININLLQNNLQSSDNYFQQARKYHDKHQAGQTSNLTFQRNYGYCFLSYGAYYQSKKDFAKAIEYLDKAKSSLQDLPTEVAALGSRFAECYLGAGDLDQSEQIALKNLTIKNLNEKEKLYNYKVLEKIYKQKNASEELIQIKDSLLLITARGYGRKIFSTLNNLETQIQLSDSARKINESKIKYNTYIYILIVCTTILFFSLLTIRINSNYQKEKTNRLELEKKVIKGELDKRNRELVSKSNFIIQRNEYLKKIQKQMDKQEIDSKTNTWLTKELDMIINAEKSYQDFDNMFVEVYPEFYSVLNKHGNISKTDLRLASYIKMNHTNDEIARISGVSIRTIESQRYRLSKKLNLLGGQSLNAFIHSI